MISGFSDLIEPLFLTWLLVVYDQGSVDKHLLQARQIFEIPDNVVAGEFDGGSSSLGVVESRGAEKFEIAQAAQTRKRISVKVEMMWRCQCHKVFGIWSRYV